MTDRIKEQYDQLKSLRDALQNRKTLSEKMQLLDALPLVKNQQGAVQDFLKKISPEDQYLIKSLLALGQQKVVSAHVEAGQKACDKLLQTLKETEQFYDVLGGVIGYHLTIIRLIWEEQTGYSHAEKQTYKKPIGMDVANPTRAVRQAIRRGLESLGKIAEIYPVGGAGDRLNLSNSEGPLPAAQLPFIGMTLLENMIRDLQGREHLYFKLFNRSVRVPIVMMTSEEKANHRHILDILGKNNWFDRPQDSYFLFTQPLVPVIAVTGEWMMGSPGDLLLKPGGHGVIWKLAEEKGAFEWLQARGCEKALVRQINNPVAGIDYGLLAFLGLGMQDGKAFGFSSCPRYLNAAEGMDILIEKQVPGGFEYRISNIEYPEFAKNGIQDEPETEGSPYSIFPANTNILFVSLGAIREAIAKDPIPGMLINMKTTVPYTDEAGEQKEMRVGRLESTMQNIADSLVDQVPHRLKPEECLHLKSFIMYHERLKTISVTKKSYVPGQPLSETPEGCFYDIQKNFYELLTTLCRMQLPEFANEEAYLKSGPSCIVHLHPALGPVWSVIAQKVQGGELAFDAELQLHLAELHLVDLNLQGSLLIEAKDLQGGRCILNQVTVKNRGINRTAPNEYWKNKVERTEALQIVLHGNAEFTAEKVAFEGARLFEVPDGHRLTVSQGAQGLDCRLEPIMQPSWHWAYAFDAEDRILLKKIDTKKMGP